MRPRLHVFGHVHAGRTGNSGRQVVYWDDVQAAYERGCEGPSGWVREVFDVWLWLAIAQVWFYGVQAVIWDRVWGGEARSGVLVNAALMKNNTGFLGNEVQVVEI